MRRNYKIIEFVCLLSCISTGAFAATCQAGYREISIAATTNDIGGCFDGNFMRYDTPNVNVSDLYYIIPDAPSGSRYTQGSCDSGEYKIPMDLVMGKIGGKCDNSYVQLFISSARNVDIPYSEKSFTVTVDGFIISDNVECTYVQNIDTGFAYSDHNPVVMKFILKE